MELVVEPQQQSSVSRDEDNAGAEDKCRQEGVI